MKFVRTLAETVRLILFFTRPFSDIIISFIYRIVKGKTKPLPPIDNALLLMSAKKIAAKIRKRQVKCEDVMRAYVDRARSVQPIINAITDARYEEALEEARLVDRSLSRGEKTPEEIERDTPLLGVPFSCKEAIGVKGLAQTCGIYAAKGRVAEKDSVTAALYRSAGAIPLTVTNVPEQCMWIDSSNLIFGITKNPYDQSRTCGGSTGGEAALLAASGAVIGIGNDIGGSIRMPSSFNGIYGHKPTTGVVSNLGYFPHSEEEISKLDHFVGTGPMCRYAEDLPLLLKVLSGDDQRLKLANQVNFNIVKVYYMDSFPGLTFSTIPSIRQAVKKAANFFEQQYGIKAIPLKFDELKNAYYIWESKLFETNLPPFKYCLAPQNSTISLNWEFFKKFFRLSNHTVPALFYSAIEVREKGDLYYKYVNQFESLKQKFFKIFEEDAIVLLPTHPELAPFYHLTLPKFPNISYTGIFNVLGFPATNIPAGMCNGFPFGIQAVSGYFNDHLTIAAAQELDKLFGGWHSPSPVNVQ